MDLQTVIKLSAVSPKGAAELGGSNVFTAAGKTTWGALLDGLSRDDLQSLVVQWRCHMGLAAVGELFYEIDPTLLDTAAKFNSARVQTYKVPLTQGKP